MLFDDFENFAYTEKYYIVGGSVRDLMLERNPKDIDIAVEKSPEDFARRVARFMNGNLVILGKPDQILYRVITPLRTYDIIRLNGATIEEDLKQRDFSLNAMAVELPEKKLIDYHQGINDIRGKTIRMVSAEVFQHDPLRLLRAFRIGAELGFSIEPATLAKIQQKAQLIVHPAAERIRAELFKLMESPISAGYVELMADTGVLPALLPELEALKHCEQNGRHQFDVLKHTLVSYKKLETLLNDEETSALFFPVAAQKTAIRKGLLKYSILLHDIGKPAVKTVDEQGRIHFYGHDLIGASMARNIAHRLRLSNFENAFTEGIIRHHIKPLLLFNAYQRNSLSNRGIIRFFITTDKLAPYILLHALADHLGKSLEAQTEGSIFYEFLAGMVRDYHVNFTISRSQPPLITGRDLMVEFKLKPSPIFNKVIRLVEETRLSREICNRQAALDFVDNYLKNQGIIPSN